MSLDGCIFPGLDWILHLSGGRLCPDSDSMARTIGQQRFIHNQCVRWAPAALATRFKGKVSWHRFPWRMSPWEGSVAKVPLEAVPLRGCPWGWLRCQGPLGGGPIARVGEAYLVRGPYTAGVRQVGPCNYGSNTPTIVVCVFVCVFFFGGGDGGRRLPRRRFSCEGSLDNPLALGPSEKIRSEALLGDASFGRGSRRSSLISRKDWRREACAKHCPQYSRISC
jgi:hypothetical protein